MQRQRLTAAGLRLMTWKASHEGMQRESEARAVDKFRIDSIKMNASYMTWPRRRCDAPGLDHQPRSHRQHNLFLQTANTSGRYLNGTRLPQKYLALKGSGYRKERKGSPLANIFRQWCDASALPCIVIEQGFGNDPLDTVVVDLVTLRKADVSQVMSGSCTI